MAMHMLQPASRHSKPASRKMSANPSSSALRRTCIEPGTTIARMLGATCLPFTYCAAIRRSSRRELVQEPMKTVFRGIGDLLPWFEVHILQSTFVSFALLRVFLLGKVAHDSIDVDDHARVDAPCHLWP